MTAEQVRAAMPADVQNVCDALRERFGARLLYLETPELTVGRDVALCESDMRACAQGRVMTASIARELGDTKPSNPTEGA